MQNLYKLFMIAFSCIVINTQAQTVSTFEGMLTQTDTFDNGKAGSKTFFSNGHAEFPVHYNTGFDYWESGVAISNKRDSVTVGSINLYSSSNGKGYNSSTYAVFQNFAVVRLTGVAKGRAVKGFYVNNGTYAYQSMANGDGFAKKFGGTSGNDSDYFLLTVRGYLNGSLKTDSVNFYLADYRGPNNTTDYIVKDWKWVDLSPLKNVDSLIFLLSSTDNGSFGMNTPGFFCVDNFTTADQFAAGLDNKKNSVTNIFPNPFHNSFTVDAPANSGIFVYTLTGEIIYSGNGNLEINSESWAKGMYLVCVESEEETSYLKIIKQ
jgi:hypothetical protein